MKKTCFNTFSVFFYILLFRSISYSQNVGTFNRLRPITVQSITTSTSQIRSASNTQKKEGSIPVDIQNTTITRHINRETKIESYKESRYLVTSKLTRIKTATKTDESESTYDSENMFERKQGDESANAVYDKLVKKVSKIVYTSATKATDTLASEPKIAYLWNRDTPILTQNTELNGVFLLDYPVGKTAGDSWSEYITVDNYDYTTRYTVKSASNQAATVSFEGMSKPSNGSSMAVRNKDNAYSSVTGAIYKGVFDIHVDTGLLTKVEVDNNTTNVIQVMGQTSEYIRSSHIIIENRIKPTK